MAEQTQQIPPNRRMRRMQMKESGVLGAISKLSYFHPVKKQIRQQNLENGRKIHQMHVDRHEAAMATFYEETGTIVDEWHVDDVLNQRPDLTEEQSCEVLAFIAKNFDANIGINWYVIDSAAEYLFPEEQSV